ncbi:uncharacterized protein ARMOST_02604 [Armillaria ostoyae]|uniref:Uncharacterized protein n=1 Tax=Armillaria ostoyae TaxID=47428 RepID=A0A284QSE5_ARMOS|nr:uncharacterized protein ARMOST_02604 [Armillaria ostoyae]
MYLEDAQVRGAGRKPTVLFVRPSADEAAKREMTRGFVMMMTQHQLFPRGHVPRVLKGPKPLLQWLTKEFPTQAPPPRSKAE